MQRGDLLNLKLCLINAENLFLLFEQPPSLNAPELNEAQWQKLSNSVYENKSLRKTQDLAKTLISINADIIMFCEVGGLESLKNFNDLFLNSEYSPVLIEGNSDRNIDVGFLVRKNLPFYFDIHSNKNRSINYLYPHERQSLATGYPVKGGKITSSHKFSRDCVELHLFTKDISQPFAILLLTHLKSRLDPERIDPHGFERRKAELQTAIEIYNELKTKFNNIPILLCGDFNGNASRSNTDEEFKALYDSSDLEDVLEIKNIPNENRSTFYQVRTGNRTDGKQIDFCFIGHNFKNLIGDNPHVYRYKDNLGLEYGIPTSLDEKLLLPSDHYPIVFELNGIKTKI